MQNMLNGFYNYIAKHIEVFFSNSNLQNGTRYYLKLDNIEMVENVNKKLIQWLQNKDIIGEYNYRNKYKTYTIKISNEKQVVIAPKLNGITNDFLTTLRNEKLTDNQFSLLIITDSTIDSISSGVGDMASSGMPFHSESIIKEIKSVINSKTDKFNKYELKVIEHGLNYLQTDKYSDKTSLFEYRSILAIINDTKLTNENLYSLNLLPDIENSISNNSESAITKALKQNNEFFTKIDSAFKNNQLEENLENFIDKKLLNRLIAKKKEGKKWYNDLTYKDILDSYENCKKKNKEVLKIEEVLIYSDSGEKYNEDNVWEFKDGGKNKNINLIIFNPDKKEKIDVEIKLNKTITKDMISYKKIKEENIDKKPNKIILHNSTKDIQFFQVEISENKTKQKIKICILNISPQYLNEIKTFSNKIFVNERNGYIEVPIDKYYFQLNPGKENEKNMILKNNSDFIKCSENTTLNIEIDKMFFENHKKQSISIECDNVKIPLKLKNMNSIERIKLSGKKAMQLKYKNLSSFEYKDDGQIVYKNQSYWTSDEFHKNLKLEEMFLNENCTSIISTDINLFEKSKKELNIPENIKTKYFALIEEYKKTNTLPSLAFYKGTLKEKAEDLVSSVHDFFSEIENGKTLTSEESDLLYLGCVFIKNENDIETIAMSPLHPLNIAYQLQLLKEKGIEKLSDNLLEKLTPLYLIPYIKYNTNDLWKIMDQTHSMEWRYYKKYAKMQYKSSKQFIRKITKNKILEYQKHFSFLFKEINNNKMIVNIVNMSNCKEIFNGFIDYFVKETKEKNEDNFLLNFKINIYDDKKDNFFWKLTDFKKLKNHIKSLNLKDISVNELALMLIKNIKCFSYPSEQEQYEYSHITFFEMDSKNQDSNGKMNNITTGISIGGITSGIPSTLDGDWFKTGFGFKYAEKNNLTLLAKQYNSLYKVAKNGHAYDPEDAGFTEIENTNNKELEKLLSSSNWLVFIEPHVDLSFFNKNIENENLIIIHYSDQLSSSNGYDDITVTRKSKQYCNIIKEQFEKNNIQLETNDVHSIIDIFNAVNGEWLLKLISNQQLTGPSKLYFSREKLSILSAIKLCLASYSDKSIIWIPISLEELLRVSKGLGLAQTNILSAKNLGFPSGPTCDDVLFVGFNKVDDQIKLYIHPVEVKIGENKSNVIQKASEQIETTYDGFKRALCYQGEKNIELKLIRNYFIDIVLNSCKKFKLYNIYENYNWDIILNDYRNRLINDEFEFSESHIPIYGKGTIVSFKSSTPQINIDKKDNIQYFDFPKKYGFEYLIKSISEIKSELNTEKEVEEVNMEINEKTENNKIYYENNDVDDISSDKTEGIHINFGVDLNSGKDLIWNPNNTNQLFHTNTGIIGTMGTGKTQFTKSLVTQLYRNRKSNFMSDDLGILIFDYKGDYNYLNEDFIEVTNAKVLELYHLPFNPLALIKTKVFKPLLPLHVANTFKDTIEKAYQLGPKQSNTLFNCIERAYKDKGIEENDPTTWDKTPPTFNDVYHIYENDEDINKNDSLAAAMQKLYKFQIFESDPSKTKSLFEILDKVIVINLNGYDPDIQSTVVAITLDQFYSQMQGLGESKMDENYRELTKMILVDEADNFMKEEYPVLRKILKEGRSFGVGTILSTQFLDHFLTGEDDYSKYIITWVVHNVDDLKEKDVNYIFKVNKKSDEEKRICNDIRKLEKHHSIVKISNNKPYYIKDNPFWKLYEEIKKKD